MWFSYFSLVLFQPWGTVVGLYCVQVYLLFRKHCIQVSFRNEYPRTMHTCVNDVFFFLFLLSENFIHVYNVFWPNLPPIASPIISRRPPQKSTQCCLCMLGCRTIYWNLRSLSESMSLKKTDPVSLSRRSERIPLLPLANSSLARGGTLWQLHVRILSALTLTGLEHHSCSGVPCTAAPMCLETSISEQCSTASGFYIPSALYSEMTPGPWGEGLWYGCPI